MSDAKKEVMKMIAKKQQKNTAYRNRSAKRDGPEVIVLDFIKAMEKVQSEAVNFMDFDSGLNREAMLMNNRMSAIDPGVNIQVVWNNEQITEDWKELQVEAVKITWSGFYLVKHPYKSQEQYVDIGALFLEGMLD